MRIFETEREPIAEISAALRPASAGPDTQLELTVRGIIADVKARGDEALLELGREFDSPKLDSLAVTEPEFDEAFRSTSAQLLDAIRTAKSNIETFHRRQLRDSWFEMTEDLVYGQIVRPIERVGIYAPAGHAPLPSTVLMAAVPGIVAGVPEMIVCAPAQADGKIHSAMLVAARECGVASVIKAGGAQAIAAMAYGTASVRKVDKIVGPGNAYVTEAKRQLYGTVGIDQLAGPSEILIIADECADPVYVAADVLSQAEHGPDSPCVVATTSRAIADAVLAEIKKQTAQAARREFIEKSIDRLAALVICRNLVECAEVANGFAPEHLEIITHDPWETLKRIRHAGMIMLGAYTPVPLCDLAAGPNHTLPTGATARFSSGLTVDEYVKKSGVLSYSREKLTAMAPTVIQMADCEGLEAHGKTVKVRIGECNG